MRRSQRVAGGVVIRLGEVSVPFATSQRVCLIRHYLNTGASQRSKGCCSFHQSNMSPLKEPHSQITGNVRISFSISRYCHCCRRAQDTKKPGPTSVIKCTGTAQENQRRSHKKEKLKRKEAPLNRL